MTLRVQLTRRWPAVVEDAFAARFELRRNRTDEPLERAALLDALAWADVVCPTVTDVLDAALFAMLPPRDRRARLLANYGVGFNHIDVPAARAAGLLISNTPDVLTEATAELTLALLLSLARRLGEGERLVRRGAWTGWAPTQLLGQSLVRSQLGVVGLGRIGAAVAKRATLGLGMEVCYYAPRDPPSDRLQGFAAQRLPSLEALLARSDVVSLHCPSTAETRGLLGAQAIALMKPGALLINTARGDLVDEAALFAALEAGHLGGAGLDVHALEPTVHPGLAGLENVVVLPHLGSATEATRTAMGERVLANVAAFADRGAVLDPV